MLNRLIGGGAAFAAALALPTLAIAAEAGAPHLDGGELGLIWVIPFAGILLSIAVFPLVAPHFWHHNFGKVAAFWAAAFLVPFTVVYGASVAVFEVIHVLLLEYIPFIILLLSLYTVAGGVRVRGRPGGRRGAGRPGSGCADRRGHGAAREALHGGAARAR